VNWPSLVPSSQTRAPQQAEIDPEDDVNPTVPILMPPPQFRKGKQQETPKAEAALPKSLTPSPPSQLRMHMPSEAELDAKPAHPVATPKGQRLFDFWHEKVDHQTSASANTSTPPPSLAVASEANAELQSSSTHSADFPSLGQARSVLHVSQTPDALNMPSSAQLAQHIQSAGPASGTRLQLEMQAASLHLGSAGTAPHQQALTQSEPAQPLRTELHSGLGQVQPSTAAAAAAAGRQHQAPADAGWCEEHGATPAALVAELEAASRLVHHQSLQQAQLLEGLEHALSELSEHRLLIQNPQAAVGTSQQGGADGTFQLHIGLLLGLFRSAQKLRCNSPRVDNSHANNLLVCSDHSLVPCTAEPVACPLSCRLCRCALIVRSMYDPANGLFAHVTQQSI